MSEPHADSSSNFSFTSFVVRDPPPTTSSQAQPAPSADLLPANAPQFPTIGETLGDFRLLAELGRGAQGRVFLAAQLSLADRPVVLKLSPCTGGEHLALARLQHTHIVPLYAMQDDAQRNLRILCMPYFGGTTLAHLLTALHQQPLLRLTGQHLIDTLDHSQTHTAETLLGRSPARQFLARATYVQAICGIGACLADALHYAHERGLVHLDIKPSNILVAADGQPMLLDFHLAQRPLRPGEPAPLAGATCRAGAPGRGLGGTLSYMAHEQQAAVCAATQQRPIPVAVDGRADIYSLGAVLYEALGGKHPYLPGISPPLHRRNPLVSPGLSDIVHKCLAYRASDRYPEATAVAADLRRHLADLPLRGVRNRSWAERWRKWRRRKPYQLALGVMLLAVLTALVGVGLVTVDHLGSQRETARRALARSQELLQKGQFPEAERVLRRGLSLIEQVPGNGALAQDLNEQLRRVENARNLASREEAARDLHHLADRVRFVYGLDARSVAGLSTLTNSCRALWQKRALILELAGPDSPPETAQRLRTDLLDLAICYADLCVEGATPGKNNAARREALGILDEAESLLGASPVLCRERQSHARALGVAEGQRCDQEARTAWEHYALGRSFLRWGDLEQAARELALALEQQPQGLWPNFYYGLCAARRGRHEEAVPAFSVCVGAAPEVAACYYNRALAFTALGRPAEALRDYTHALERDPHLAGAALNRGILHFKERQYPEARANLLLAIDEGADPAVVHYNLALIHKEQGQKDAARLELRLALESNPRHSEARTLLEALAREH
jgi:serine/threonine protein kinase/Tfp pilus assembly protein PilF